MSIWKILEIEYENTWNSKVIGVIFLVLSASYIYSLKGSATILWTHTSLIYLSEFVRGYLASSIVLVIFVSYVFSKSVSKQISSGLIKTWLGFPIKRNHLLLAKFIFGYLLLISSEILPLLYSGYLYGFNIGLFIVLITMLLKILFYSSYTMFFSLIIRDPLVSFAGSLLSLYAIELAPSFLYNLGLEDIANIININNVVFGLYRVLNTKWWIKEFLEIKLWVTPLIYIGISIFLILLSLQIFKKMDLD